MILHCMGDDYRDEAKIWSAAMWTCGSCSAIAWQGKRGIYGICTKIYHIIMIRLLLMFSPKFAVHFAFFCLRTMLDVSEPNFWDTPKRAFWCPEECALEAKINKVREKEPMVFQRCDMTFSPGDPCWNPSSWHSWHGNLIHISRFTDGQVLHTRLVRYLHIEFTTIVITLVKSFCLGVLLVWKSI